MNSPVSPAQAARELLRRRSIRRSLTEFCRLCGYQPAKHHRLLIDALEALERGDIQRLGVFMPPGSAKSTYASILFPPWLMARQNANVLAASHTTELAEKWGRRVRNLVSERALILGARLADDSQAAGRWALSSGAEYYAAGVGTGIAGFRAKFGLIDDPIRSRQDADSELIRDRIWDWYINDFRTRLVPGARELLIQCMTGDTLVLMATGEEKRLSDVRPGDQVATYEDGCLSVSRVINWINNGPDRVFKIRMKSGIAVRANARHPFLVEVDGETKWQRTATLKKGSVILRAIGASGGVSLARPMAAIDKPHAKACATRTTTSLGGRRELGRLLSILAQGVRRICATAMELAFQSTSVFLPSRVVFAPCAVSHPRRKILALTGKANCASIIATIAKKSEDFFATTATSLLGTGKLKASSSPPLNTYEIARDTVVDVVDGGIEDVFDVQIERTENFIANGLVSHNTRWHEDDLAGRALNHADWHVISLPAEAEDNDILGRKPGEWLWSDGDYGYGAQLEELKRNTPARTWSALYQQRPAPEEGDYFRAEWLKSYTTPPPRDQMHIYGASDYAVTADGGDYTVHVVVGIDPAGRLYLLDLWRKQAASDEWIEAFCDLVKEWKPLGWAEETGQIRAGVGPFLDRRQFERGAYVAREQFPTRGDKAVRAQSIRGRMGQHGLYVDERAPWFAAFRSELLSFPAGKHDDQVDALGLVGQLLDQMVEGAAPVKPEPKVVTGYRSMEVDRADDWKSY